ncbi:ACP S-malonyltransferase [Dethiobacter alkaliphilus]|uniref:Malonyl CoA-acyl carrier protein transacylase n=1 Tax=Dethiobacter alkaliphilus AHT 1 TaxID=555088 RepID=C0GHK7_DETAL|nr:ACP S-malonyltransferase [Dethiobacter alkaliphilus]EEG77213.1 malonyl CoA-acyl carrier protein transacylase [Dethiobacter alkaliphilus AHT 1]
MGKIAFIFPGQGAQHVGMGQEMAENFSAARQVFEQADDILGMNLSEKVFNGSDDELRLTEITQPAIVATSIACLEVLRQHGVQAHGVAGLSLGEYSALVAAEAMSFADALPVVQKRGRYMQEAVPPGVGGMSAILGLAREKVHEACRQASAIGVIEPANYNTPDQIVIAGEIAAMRKACEVAKELGAKRIVELPVSVSFHCSLLKNVEPLLAGELAQIELSPAKIPVMANISADYVNSVEEMRDSLVRQVSNAILWQDSIEKMIADGYDTFVEVGPGKSLTGMMKKINRDVWAHQVENVKTLEKVVEAING